MGALMAAIVCIATVIIKIPSPLKGYLNLGDGIVLLCGWLLSPGYAFLAAGLGSALADAFSGYFTYVPATFVIKGMMALIAFASLRLMRQKRGGMLFCVIGGVLAEIVMVLGYYTFEGFLYGFLPSAVNIPANGVQGGVGLLIGLLLYKVLDGTKIFRQ